MFWIVSALAVLITLDVANALPYPFFDARDVLKSRNLNSSQIIKELQPQLSSGAILFGQDAVAYAAATARWSAFGSPSFTVVVEPGTEKDVAITVGYANAVGVDFLAVNQGHGSTETLATMKTGIQINLRSLKSIQISPDGGSAMMQGGADTMSIITSLWAAGKVTATASAACVGAMGAALGGGHGRYEGFYGLIMDNLISMNVVLADGTAVTTSASENRDLWWAMKGAGHNFGIVTSFNMKIYPKTVDTWYYVTYVFTQDKLEPLFQAINTMMQNGTQPRELLNDLNVLYVDSISTTEPVILYTVYYVGSAQQAAQYTAPYEKLGYISRTADNLSYPDLVNATGTGPSSPFCLDGLTHIQRPLGLLTYNVTANRQVYNLFKNRTQQEPAFHNSVIQFEAYSVVGTKAIDSASTAYAHRADNILVSPQFIYMPNSALDQKASQWTQEIINAFAAGQPGRQKTTYVNYAFGDEPVEQIYGYEPWRLQKLRGLKQIYDPRGHFNHYNPFTTGHY